MRAMLREYVAWIGLDLAFQEIDAELDGLPGDYAPPRGALLVALDDAEHIGMIALRPLLADTSRAAPVGPQRGLVAEMKRLMLEARGE